jgi:hypothetical protein
VKSQLDRMRKVLERDQKMPEPSLRNVKKSLLRDIGRAALEGPGIGVEEVPGRGIMPGAKVQISEPGKKPRVATIRVSLDREVALTRHPDGKWVTVPNVDEVIFVVPAADGSDSAEVLSFRPSIVIDAFNHALDRLKRQNPALSYKAPVFVALDDATDDDFATASSALKEKAQWTKVISIDSVRRSRQRESVREFRERVHREFAKLQGLDISDVAVEFTIKAMVTKSVKGDTKPDE